MLTIKTGYNIKDLVYCNDIVSCRFILFKVTRKTDVPCVYLANIDVS